MKRGFTLIELLVVIGIIGILAGVLLASFSGGNESARAATCLTNMKNLAAACQSYGAEHGHYPLAGSVETMGIDESLGMRRARASYGEVSGWISWNSRGTYQHKPTSHQASLSWWPQIYSTDKEESLYCLTNGALWKYLSGNHSVYVCPSHANKNLRVAGDKGSNGSQGSVSPNWSYLMNAYFGWDTSQGSKSKSSQGGYGVSYGHLARADKVLLFSEVPFRGLAGSWEATGSGIDSDCTLQFDTSVSPKFGSLGAAAGGSGSENIGFNHKSGKVTFANVVFADGHVEKLRLPKDGLSDAQLKTLTAWLCMGEDVSFDGKQYSRLEN